MHYTLQEHIGQPGRQEWQIENLHGQPALRRPAVPFDRVLAAAG